MEDAEAEMKRRMLARGVGQERERQLNEATVAALREAGTLTEIPTGEQVVLGSIALTEKQRKLLTEFWTLRAENYSEYHALEEFEKLLVALRRRKKRRRRRKKETEEKEGRGSKTWILRRLDI